jgi:hypothetical protein
MRYHTIKEIEDMLDESIKIIDVSKENNWLVIVLSSGVKIRIRNY